ncbi:MAG TPA: tetratricopeptide repeat protein [Thermoanaerobaculaceae bacterium]|nr:tetratricopeptide repeat protein [Thermoanaerobaculaceae bacterium]
MWKNPIVALLAGALLGFVGGYLVGQGQPLPAPAAAPSAANPHAGVPGAPPLGPTGSVSPAAAMPDQRLMQQLRDIEALLVKTPESYDLLTKAGNTLFDMNSYSRAIDYYERARRLQDGSPDVDTDLGVCYRETGNTKKAVELFTRAATLAPTHWQSRFNLLVVNLFDLGDLPAAEKQVAELRKLDVKAPGFPDLAMFEKEITKRKAAGPSPTEK